MTETQATIAFPELQSHQYANLTTFRKSGEAILTPIWFAQRGDKLYVLTQGQSGKVKRIRNNPQVQLAPCTMNGKPLGPSVDAQARIMAPDEVVVAKVALNQKYGFVKGLFDFFMALSGTDKDNVYLEIVSGH